MLNLQNGNEAARVRAISIPSAEFSAEFHLRRGTGPTPFANRLARARLLYLCRREAALNWLALSVLVVAWNVAAFAPPL
jgi:hypothetical protein